MYRLLEEIEMAYNWKSKRAWWEMIDLALLSFVEQELR